LSCYIINAILLEKAKACMFHVNYMVTTENVIDWAYCVFARFTADLGL